MKGTQTALGGLEGGVKPDVSGSFLHGEKRKTAEKKEFAFGYAQNIGVGICEAQGFR